MLWSAAIGGEGNDRGTAVHLDDDVSDAIRLIVTKDFRLSRFLLFAPDCLCALN